MRFITSATLLALLLIVTASPARAEDTASTVVHTYCAGCHNGTMRSPSDMVLDRFDGHAIGDNPDAWARAYRQVQAGTMPPVGAPRPDRPGVRVLLAAIEARLGAGQPLRFDGNNRAIGERLATLLWNGAPDAALLEDMGANRLTKPDVLDRQVQRMLADDRADAFVTRFFFPWLGLDRLAQAEPNPTYFPNFEVRLRDDMAKETDLFVRSQLAGDRDPIDLWTADYTFLNEPLARHYGVPGVTGGEFRRVALSTPERRGLLGQGSVLMITSHHQGGKGSPYTSPASRSTWVERHFLGAAPPHPFPGAKPTNPAFPTAPQTRALPAQPCVACHRNFFPLGYALEHFDAVGAWRVDDQAGPVDASGALVDGTPFDGTADLRAALLQYADAFRTTITERLLMYADGKPVNGTQPTAATLVRARQVLRSTQPVRWSSLISAIVRSTPE